MKTQSKKTGWEGSIKVSGIEPKRGLREAIIGCMVDNDYIDSADQMQAIDDWHYQVTGDMRRWKNKENLLYHKLNEALFEAGWNVRVDVKFKEKNEDAFIIDLSDHTFRPYYMLQCYDGHYNWFDREVDVTRNKDKFILRLIHLILDQTDDIEERVERVTELLEGEDIVTDNRNGDEYSIVTMCPQLLLQDGEVVAEYGLVGTEELIYTDSSESDEYEDEDLYLYTLNIQNDHRILV